MKAVSNLVRSMRLKIRDLSKFRRCDFSLDIPLVIFSGPKDYATTRLILEELKGKYIGPIYIVSPDRIFSGKGVVNIVDEEILSERANVLPGWFKQQLLKLLILEHTDEGQVFILDGDTCLVRGVPLIQGEPVKLVSWESLLPYSSFLELFDNDSMIYSTITHMAYYDLPIERRIKKNLPNGIESIEDLVFYCYENGIRFSEYLLIGMFTQAPEMYFFNRDVFSLEELKHFGKGGYISVSLQQWKSSSHWLKRFYHKIISI